MATFRKGLDLYDHQRRMFDEIPQSAREAFRALPDGARDDLHALTSGDVSTRELRAMGNPYAKAAGGVAPRGASKSYVTSKGLKSAKGLAPLLPINRQGGALQDSITQWDRSTPSVLDVSVGFDAAKAGRSIFAILPQGTRTVVARGIWVAVAKNDRIRLRAFRDAFGRGLARAASRP